jgi:nitroimidazol reductase NimA-like FMN-containing flavoprotein (pyridoxamine 5'-phosphate oxidase superfamily)
LNKQEKNRQEIRNLFSGQPLAVLATHFKGQPHTSLIGFASTENLKYMIFVTKRSTHKHRNLIKNPPVSLLIDNRTNQAKDFQSAEAVTVFGKSEEISKQKEKKLVDLYVKKHPYLRDFVRSPDSALIRVKVEKFSLVSQFQKVEEVIP